jgi:hypothetical protein
MWIVGSYQQSRQRVAQSGKPTDELNSRNYGTLTLVFVLGESFSSSVQGDREEPRSASTKFDFPTLFSPTNTVRSS